MRSSELLSVNWQEFFCFKIKIKRIKKATSHQVAFKNYFKLLIKTEDHRFHLKGQL